MDSHIHAIRAGLSEITEVNWSGFKTLDQALNHLAERASQLDLHEWVVVAGGWVPEQFEEQRSPTLAELEQAAQGRPAYIQRAYSAVLINQEGMLGLPWHQHAQLASRLKAEQNEQGHDTGWLLGDARTISDVYDLLPGPDASQQIVGSLQWYRRLASWGVTAVLDPGGYNLPLHAYRATQELWKRRQLPVRIRYSLSAPRKDTELEDFKHHTALIPMGWGDSMLKFNGLGENVTWSMYNNSKPEAAHQQPLKEVLVWAARQGLGVTFHWNQDETVGRLLEVLEAVHEQHDLQPLRWSIAHLNNASRPSLERMKRMGIGWLVQNAAYYQRPFMKKTWGEAALLRTPPMAEALELGIHMGLGTDAHRVMTPNPFVCLQWAVDGLSADGQKTRSSSALLSREQALDLYTHGSAWFTHEEHERGRLQVGFLADLAMLNDSYLNIKQSLIHTLHSELTLVAGRAVHGPTSLPVR